MKFEEKEEKRLKFLTEISKIWLVAFLRSCASLRRALDPVSVSRHHLLRKGPSNRIAREKKVKAHFNT